MNKKELLIGLIVLFGLFGFTTKSTNNSMSNDGYTVDEFYKKIGLDDGALDEDGNSIDFIFVETDLDQGKYEIELTDGPGDLYEIKGTNIFITFNGYFGYAGYGTECILKVNGGYYSSTVYKIE
ncbi:hypothetical protein [Marinilabilia salmonicolor]|uniref:hypothetical protein n=1 Tax=Marinilabilia salmonicolor TaxID=989 RepID=UPI00029AA285|nr:hypothetical protein [Marinilabilia salmonicolor]